MVSNGDTMSNDNSNAVWVVVEQDQGQLAEVSLELLNRSKALADKIGGEPSAVLAGHNVGELPQTLIAHGAKKVYVIDDERLGDYTTLPFAKSIADLAQERRPEIMLFGATMLGRDLAPRVASILRCGLTADCTDLKIGDYVDPKTKAEYKDILYQIRPAFGGNIIATIVSPDHRPQMATVREGVFPLGQSDESLTGEVITVGPTLTQNEMIAKVVDRVKAEKKVNLKGAQVIVSGAPALAGRTTSS